MTLNKLFLKNDSTSLLNTSHSKKYLIFKTIPQSNFTGNWLKNIEILENKSQHPLLMKSKISFHIHRILLLELDKDMKHY